MAQSQCKLGMKWWQTHVDASKTVADMQKKKRKQFSLAITQSLPCYLLTMEMHALGYAFYLNIFFIS